MNPSSEKWMPFKALEKAAHWTVINENHETLFTCWRGEEDACRICELHNAELRKVSDPSKAHDWQPEITAKFLEECGYVRKGGARLTYQGGDNIAPTAIEYYNPETGHSVLEFISIQPRLLEKGKEAQYVKRWLYWAALTQETENQEGIE